MKKLVSIGLCLIMAAASLLPAAADVIWEPTNNFYYEHYGECVNVELPYETKKDTPIQASPTDRTQVGVIPQYTTVWVYLQWGDWGYTECANGEGWVDLTRFRRIYCASDFVEEHKDEFYLTEGWISRQANGTIYYWAYPGAAAYDGYIDANMFYWTDEDVQYQALWWDQYFRCWAYMGYYYGATGWICLDDPGNPDVSFYTPKYVETEAEAHQRIFSTLFLVITLLFSAAVIVIALVLKQKKGKEPPTDPA